MQKDTMKKLQAEHWSRSEPKRKKKAKTETLRHIAHNMTLDTHKSYSVGNTAKSETCNTEKWREFEKWQNNGYSKRKW